MMTKYQLRQRTSEQIAAEIEELLRSSDPLTRTQIKTSVRAASGTITPILARMRADGILASFETKGPVQRGVRRDERWCMADRLPVQDSLIERFRGAEILEGFQIAARAYAQQRQSV